MKVENQLLPENVANLIANFKTSELEGQLHSVFFRESSLRKILDMKGCQGIRFHLGKEAGKLHIIVEPCDKSGNPIAAATETANRDLLGDSSGAAAAFFSPDNQCPDQCPPAGGN